MAKLSLCMIKWSGVKYAFYQGKYLLIKKHGYNNETNFYKINNTYNICYMKYNNYSYMSIFIVLIKIINK